MLVRRRISSEDVKTTTLMHKQDIVLGVILGVLASICFTMMSLFGKLIGDNASIDTILFARFAISLLLILPWVVKNPNHIIEVIQPSKLILRSLLTLLALGCFFYSLRFISLANALLLNNTAPLFVPLVAWVSLGVKTSYQVWMGLILGFVGIALVLNPTQNLFELPSLIALSSGVFAGIAVVTIRSLTKIASVVQILFYNFLFCTIVTGLLLPFDWKRLDVHTLLLLLGTGLFGAIYQFFSTLSFAKASVRLVSSLMFLCIVFGVFADFIIWHNIPQPFTLLGMLLVIAGGAITLYFGQKEMAARERLKP